MISYKVDTALYFGVLFALFTRWGTSLFPYSGAGKSPMYGDYEAQRHWMEITINLPETEWYRNSSENDLQYWGLDYPPLTAYHSLICGYIAKYFNKNWVKLNSSRGFESPDHKIFMRTTVIVIDVLVYFTAVVLYWSVVAKPYKRRDKAIAITLTLLYPGLILIDHGHFQYNCVSLGLTLWSILLIYMDCTLLAASAFTLALNYKQMELYHAIPLFAYLLGQCKQQGLVSGTRKFIFLGLTVILTTLICWLPFIMDTETPKHLLERLFPVARGIYEDKVANIWCALSIVIKLKNMSTNNLILISAGSTLLSILPSSIHLFLNPNFAAFKFSLINSSLAFFLFSYQVHEKSILLAAIPFLLLLDDYPILTSWFSVISTFSLLPLLTRDGLTIPYFALTLIYLAVARQTYRTHWLSLTSQSLTATALILSFFGCILLSVTPFILKPPKRYPDLFVVLNVLYSCGHFLLFLIYCNIQQIQNGGPAKTMLKKKN